MLVLVVLWNNDKTIDQEPKQKKTKDKKLHTKKIAAHWKSNFQT